MRLKHRKELPLPGPLWEPCTGPINSFGWSFLSLLYTKALITWNRKENPQWAFRALSLCSSFFSGVCPANSGCFGFPGPPAPRLQLSEVAEIFGVSSTYTAAWDLFSRQQWRPLVGLILFVSHFSGIKIFCCLRSEVLYDIFSNTASSFFSCFKWKGRSCPSYSIFNRMQFDFKTAVCHWVRYYDVINESVS